MADRGLGKISGDTLEAFSARTARSRVLPPGLVERFYAEHCRVRAAANIPTNHQMFILESTRRMTVGAAMCVATGRPAMAPFANPGQFDDRLNESMQQGNWSDAKLFTEMLRVFLDGVEADYSPRDSC
ncbi:hypothetical protein QM716_22630 [Rhodococcus sp. IEGM 1409]|uniref:hypothetical protein n=1 Tax=Rhodococcus sp. IEGM 1409 TaxID=3047082 RepID=UPI0024B76859|nr:hypothetical protein [Rhodococcus sp. IEGM 1409]MDI9902656.1 hypothetical protein [Rhodococcus sp. IEGM 1409]